MDEMIPVGTNNLPTEANRTGMPIPAEGKQLYLTQHSKGVDFHTLLGQVLQCVNMGDILAEIKAGTQYAA